MSWFIYNKSSKLLLGMCETPDAQGHVPQVTDYNVYGVIEVTDPATCKTLTYGGCDSYRVESGAVRAATVQELTDATTATSDLTAKQALDMNRVLNAVVCAIIDTYSAPLTQAKFQTARTKAINFYKSQPWIGWQT